MYTNIIGSSPKNLTPSEVLKINGLNDDEIASTHFINDSHIFMNDNSFQNNTAASINNLGIINPAQNTLLTNGNVGINPNRANQKLKTIQVPMQKQKLCRQLSCEELKAQKLALMKNSNLYRLKPYRNDQHKSPNILTRIGNPRPGINARTTKRYNTLTNRGYLIEQEETCCLIQ